MNRGQVVYKMRQRAQLLIKAWLQSAAPNKPKFSDLEDRIVSAMIDTFEFAAKAKLEPEIPGAARVPGMEDGPLP